MNDGDNSKLIELRLRDCSSRYRMFQNKEINKMANDKKMVEAITSMDEDFAQWYTDVALKAGLIAYTNVKG